MFQNILQVTSREPLAFILFIASLKKLREEIERLAGIALPVRVPKEGVH